jgi:cytidine deaminase
MRRARRRSAIAEMLKAHESEIALVVAVDEQGTILLPCGRCREMMWQLESTNKCTSHINIDAAH